MTQGKNEQDQTTPSAAPCLPDSTAPALTVDYDLYAEYLEDSDLSEEQKREFLQALWSIIVDFVSLGFEVHPVQQAQDACGKLSDSPRNQPEPSRGEVQFNNHSIRREFEAATTGKIVGEERIQE